MAFPAMAAPSSSGLPALSCWGLPAVRNGQPGPSWVCDALFSRIGKRWRKAEHAVAFPHAGQPFSVTGGPPAKQGMLHVLLKDRLSGQSILAATTHLKAKRGQVAVCATMLGLWAQPSWLGDDVHILIFDTPCTRELLVGAGQRGGQGAAGGADDGAAGGRRDR